MARRRGVSPIVAELMILALVVSMGTGIFFFASNSVTSYSNGLGLLFGQNGQQAQEIYDVEYAQFLSSSQEVVPVTVTNNQPGATPAPFQQMVTFNPSAFPSYEASDLGNIRFCADSGCSTPLYAWLDGCTPSCSPTATSATAFVKLTASIPGGGGSTTIYMQFLATDTEFDGVYWGEAPQLSATYAQYDNGANVFPLYFDGNTPVSSFTAHTAYTVSQASVPYGSGSVNAIEVTGTGSGSQTSDAQFAYGAGVPNAGYVQEVNWEPASSANKGFLGLGDSLSLGSIQNAEGAYVAGTTFDREYKIGGTASTASLGVTVNENSTWYYGALYYGGPSATSYNVTVSHTQYSGTLETVAPASNPLASASTVYFTPLSDHTGTASITYYYNWGLLRSYPPGGVMPAISVGTISVSYSHAVDVTIGNVGYVETQLASLAFYNSSVVGAGYPTSFVYTLTTSPSLSIVGSNASPYCTVSGSMIVIPTASYCTVSVPFNWYAGASYNMVLATQRGNSVEVQENA